MRAHWTLWLAIPYLAVSFAVRFGGGGKGALAASEAYGLAAGLAVSLFASVLVHEVCHTVVGVRLGARVRGIMLMFLGGVSEMSRPPPTAGGEVAMAAAGPGASLAIGALAWGLAHVTGGLLALFLRLFAQLNLVIAVFNMLPAFPLDGGRVLRGLLALRLGEERATRAAVRIGQAMAIALGILGVLSGALVLVLIAVFVFVSAGAEGRVTAIEARLEAVPVARVMDLVADVVDADAPVEEAAARLARTDRRGLLVAHDGRVVGWLPLDRIRAVPYAERLRVPASAIMVEPPAPVAPAESAALALRRMRESALDELPVVEDRQLVGTVRLDRLGRYAEELAPRG